MLLGVGMALPLAPMQSLTACQETKTLPPIADAGDTITMAFLASLTGSEGAVGQPLKNAVKVAEWQINAAGGLLGKRVFFRVEDDATDPNKSGQLADVLIQANVPALIGPTASPQAAVATPKFFQSKTIQISSTVTLTSLRTDQPANDRYFFRTLPAADVQGRVLANLAFQGPPIGEAGAPVPCRNMAMALSDDNYGNPFSGGIEQKFVELGGTVVGKVKYPADVKADYNAEVAQIIAFRPMAECISLVSFGPAGAGFIKDFKKAIATDTSRDWSKVPIIGANALYTSTFINNARTDPANPASPSATEGMYGVLVDPAPDTAQYNAFKRIYLEQFPLPAGTTAIPRNTANTYDAAILLALAIEAAGGMEDRIKIRDKLFEVSRGGTAYGPAELAEAIEAIHRGVDIDYNGASGNVDFDQYGEVSEDFIIWKIVNGNFTTIQKVKATSTL